MDNSHLKDYIVRYHCDRGGIITQFNSAEFDKKDEALSYIKERERRLNDGEWYELIDNSYTL